MERVRTVALFGFPHCVNQASVHLLKHVLIDKIKDSDRLSCGSSWLGADVRLFNGPTESLSGLSGDDFGECHSTQISRLRLLHFRHVCLCLLLQQTKGLFRGYLRQRSLCCRPRRFRPSHSLWRHCQREHTLALFCLSLLSWGLRQVCQALVGHYSTRAALQGTTHMVQ